MSWKMIKVGDRIQINAFSHKGQKGYVRFKGEVEGFVGEMLGIELDEPNGKDIGGHFHCQEGHGIFFRSAQVKNIPDDGKDVKPQKEEAKGLKKSMIGLKKPASTSKASDTASKDESKDESEDHSEEVSSPQKETTRQTEKVVPPRISGIAKGGIKGASSRASMAVHKGEESTTGGESARASKVSKIKESAASKIGLKKPAEGETKKPTDSKSIAQKKEDLKNKVKAKKLEGGDTKAKEGEEKKLGIKKFSKPTKPSTTKVEKHSSESKDHHEDIGDAEVAKLEASLKHENQEHKTEEKVKTSGIGFKKPATGSKVVTKIGGSKIGMKKPSHTNSHDESQDHHNKNSEAKEKVVKEEYKMELKISNEETKKEHIEEKKEVSKKEKQEAKPEEKPEKTQSEEHKPSQTTEKRTIESVEEHHLLVEQPNEQNSDEKTVQKKVFKKPDSVENESATIVNTSNLKMLQQAKVELVKKDSLITKMSDELKELYDKIRTSDEIHSTETEILRLEYEDKIEKLTKDVQDKEKLVIDVRLRAERAEANAKRDDDVSVSKKEIEEIKAKVQKLQNELSDKDKIIEEMNQELEKYRTDNEQKTTEIESLKLDIETIQVEKSILEEEKQIIENEMRQQEEDRIKSMEESMTDDELRFQNERLRIAIRKLTNDIETERANWEKEKAELEEQVNRIPELEEKLGDIDLLLATVEERDEEIEAMKQTVQEASDFQQMVEELTEEIVEKDEMIVELEAKVSEMEEIQAVQEEINANQEKFEAEMNEELNKKDIKIQHLENDIQILEEALLEQDDKETKYKERMNEISKENELLKDQLNSAYDEKTKNKISDMIEKQKNLQYQIRELSRKEIGGSLAEINVGISNTLADLYQSFIPEKLLSEGYISNFNKIRLVIFVKHKSYLMYNELCKKKFIEGSDFQLGEGQQENYEYFRYMCTLGYNGVRCINLCQKILHALVFMDQEKYKTIVDSSFWTNFVMANSFLDNTIQMIRDDTLTTKVNQKSFEETLDEFEKFYNENIRNAVNDDIKSKSSKQDFDIEGAPKNVVKEHILKIGLAILALGLYIRQREFYQGVESDRSLQEKCRKAYWRMVESVMAIDEIDDENHGDEYFKTNFNLVKRINDKFEFVHAFWKEDAEEFTQSLKLEQEVKTSDTSEESKTEEGTSDSPSKIRPQSNKIQYDWFAWVDSVERDISSIMSDDTLQTLKEKVKVESPSPFIKKLSKGPWMILANNIKEAMSQADVMKDENEKLKVKVKDQNIQIIKMQKSIDDYEIIKEQLERKAAEFELESQKLTPLMSDKKRLEEKISYIQGELVNKEKIIATQKEKIDKVTNEKLELEKKKANEAKEDTSRSKSRKSIMGKLLSKTSDKDNDDVIIDESTLALLDDIQDENIKLRRSKLFERMSKLSNSSSAFNKFMKDNNQTQETPTNSIKLTDEESAGIHSAVNEINGIRNNIRLKMCKAKVIKLGDKNEESAQDSEHYLREIIKHKQENIKDLSKAKINMSKINQIMFGGVPDEELSTSFQKFIDESTIQKIEKSNEWKVIGRVKIKPPNGEIKDGKERVERVYLDQFSAHKILKVLPTLPSLC